MSFQFSQANDGEQGEGSEGSVCIGSVCQRVKRDSTGAMVSDCNSEEIEESSGVYGEEQDFVEEREAFTPGELEEGEAAEDTFDYDDNQDGNDDSDSSEFYETNVPALQTSTLSAPSGSAVQTLGELSGLPTTLPPTLPTPFFQGSGLGAVGWTGETGETGETGGTLQSLPLSSDIRPRFVYEKNRKPVVRKTQEKLQYGVGIPTGTPVISLPKPMPNTVTDVTDLPTPESMALLYAKGLPGDATLDSLLIQDANEDGESFSFRTSYAKEVHRLLPTSINPVTAVLLSYMTVKRLSENVRYPESLQKTLEDIDTVIMAST